MVDRRYKDFIKSQQWKNICARYWIQNGRRCKACGSPMNVELHHLSYERFGGREVMSDLIGLCRLHHRELHRLHRMAGRPNLREFSIRYINKIQQAKRKSL